MGRVNTNHDGDLSHEEFIEAAGDSSPPPPSVGNMCQSFKSCGSSPFFASLIVTCFGPRRYRFSGRTVWQKCGRSDHMHTDPMLANHVHTDPMLANHVHTDPMLANHS
jgi:hypothetical protein